MRLVVEHPDGRRVAVEASAFDDPAANPFNHDRTVVVYDNANGTSRTERAAGRAGAEAQSLRAEGFRPVAVQPDGGGEAPLPKGYRWSPKGDTA